MPSLAYTPIPLYPYTPIPLYPYTPKEYGVIAEGEGVRGTAILCIKVPLYPYAPLVRRQDEGVILASLSFAFGIGNLPYSSPFVQVILAWLS